MANRIVEAVLRLSSKLGSMAAFSKVAENFEKVDRKARDFNRRQGMVAAGARTMGGALLRYAAPAAVAYGVKAAYVEFAELERRMERIGITAGASADETKAALEAVRRGAQKFALPLDQAIAGLDTLVSSGMSMKEALAFLPSVLATAQAAGAATEDIANTALKAAGALKLEAGQMQHAFDIMVAGGKAGQFELKDMAAFIPELANSFAALGYEGEDGLKKLIALLQTLREDTGTAGDAATQAQNIFGKVYSEETAGKFAKFGIDLRTSLDQAKKSGEDVLAAFIRLSNEAVRGDLSKLPLLFSDQELRQGMLSLMTGAESYRKFIDTLNSSKVKGTALRDVDVLVKNSQTSIDRLQSSWDRFKKSVGEAAAPVIDGGQDILGDGLEVISESLSKADAINAQLEREGYDWLGRRLWWMNSDHNPLQDDTSFQQDGKAWQGGYRTEEQEILIREYGTYATTRTAAGDVPGAPRPTLPKDASGLPVAGPAIAHRDGILIEPAGPEEVLVPVEVPVPPPRPSAAEREFDEHRAEARRDFDERLPKADLALQYRLYGERNTVDPRNMSLRAFMMMEPPPDIEPPPVALPPRPTFREAEEASMTTLRRDHNAIANEIEAALTSGSDHAGEALGRGGEDAGRSITEAARAINQAGSEAGATFRAMLEGVGRRIGAEAAASFRSNLGPLAVKVQGDPKKGGWGTVSGVPGRTMPDAGSTPKTTR